VLKNPPNTHNFIIKRTQKIIKLSQSMTKIGYTLSLYTRLVHNSSAKVIVEKSLVQNNLKKSNH